MKLFISFNKVDLEFARWIAWNAERVGCDVVFQEWDFTLGTDFVEQMRRGLEASDKLIAVLSPAYLDAGYTHPEWHEFFRRDPTGEKGLLLLVRVAECDSGALLNTRIHVDLFGCDEREARRRLLVALRGERRKPKRAPRFPETRFPLPEAVPKTGSGDGLGRWSAEGRNALEVLADLYHLASARRDELRDLHVDADGWQRFQKAREAAAKGLSVDSRLTIRLKHPLASLAGDDAALAAALHTVTAACRSRLWELGPQSVRTSAALGSVVYRVTPDDSPFAGDFPRHQDELSATLESLYAPEIRFIPAESGGLRLTPITLGAAARARLRDCREKRLIRIGLSSLGGDAEFEGERVPGFPEEEARRFRLIGLLNSAAEQEKMMSTLRGASESGAAILVLPELRVTPAMEGAAQEFLARGRHSLAMVIAGSWHYAEETGWVNRCTVLGARGEIVWQHRKLREYRATAENVAAAPEFFAGIGVDGNGGFESILCGRMLEYCETPIGRLCVAICVGFFHPDVQPALAATRADYFLVPAMTPSATDLHRTAEQLARNWAATLVANCGVVGRTAPSFWRKPLRNERVEEAVAEMEFVDFNLS